jgi:hypothetical protein
VDREKLPSRSELKKVAMRVAQAILLTGLLSVVTPTEALALDDDAPGCISCDEISASAGNDGVTVGGTETSAGGGGNDEGPRSHGTRPEPTGPVIEDVYTPVCTGNTPDGLRETCETADQVCEWQGLGADYTFLWHWRRTVDRETGEVIAPWDIVDSVCLTDVPEPEPDQRVDPATVASEWKRITFPAGRTYVQPAGGSTLINFDTVFYTQVAVDPVTTTILGHAVVIRTKPRFTWHFGDGQTLMTDKPGRPHAKGDRKDDVTHDYTWRDPGVPFQARVTITYTATYSVDGGPARPVPGQVVVDGPPTPILVKTAHSRFVAPTTRPGH